MVRRQFGALFSVAVLLGASSLGCSTNGSSCSVVDNADGTATLSCSDGTSTVIRPGSTGTNCTVSTNLDGSHLISCDDGTMVTIHDGMDGPDGSIGPPGPPGRNSSLTGPGLDVEVRSSGIATDGHPFMELRYTDAAGRPLDRDGVYTDGAISTSFTIAHLPVEVRIDGPAVLTFTSYLTETVTGADGVTTGLQPVTDTGGTWTEVDAVDGVYRYDFGGMLPAGYLVDETHRIGLYATRTFDSVRFVANATSTFRPDGMPVATTRDIVTNAACSSCHSPLSAHGGAREDVQLCVTCHGRGFTDPDTGASLDFETMIHRIHRGENLPSVEAGIPYQIIGYRGSVHDYSTVAFPRDIRTCSNCHTGPDGTPAVAPHADLTTTQPSRAACGSCHDDVWFEPGAPPAWMHLHPGGDRPDDSRCSVCHTPTGPGVAPIPDDHFTNPELAIAQQPEVTVDAVTLTAARLIQLDFTVTVNGAPRDILAVGGALTSLSAIVAGPTTDYLFNASFTLTSASAGTLIAIDAPMGQFRWTSASTVDAIAATANADPIRNLAGATITPTGTWGIGLQATLRVNAAATTTSCTASSTCAATAGHLREGSTWGCIASFCTPQVLYAARNPVAYLALTDTTAAPRRELVESARCDSCHQQLALHGGGRNAPELCVMCHNSTFDTIDRMPVPAGGTATTHSLSLANFVHRIHTGENGVSDATYWSPPPSPRPTPGTGGNVVEFNELRYPADRRVCQQCHVEPAAGISIADATGLSPARTRLITDTRMTLATYSMPIIASACTGCHDGPDVAIHTEAMTTASGAESCQTCHEPGEAFGIDTVHARPEYDLR